MVQNSVLIPNATNSSYRVPAKIGRAQSELQSPCNLVCRLLLEKKKDFRGNCRTDAYTVPWILQQQDGESGKETENERDKERDKDNEIEKSGRSKNADRALNHET